MNFFNKQKREKVKIDEYRSLFLNESNAPPARFGKSIYIQKVHHERISQVISVIAGKKITLSDYINNVLSNHFREYEGEITQLFSEKVIF